MLKEIIFTHQYADHALADQNNPSHYILWNSYHMVGN